MSLPTYALQYAPIVYLHNDELFLPSHPVEHLANTRPRTYGGTDIDVPADVKAKVKMLGLPNVNKGDTFLTLNVRMRPPIV
jgi:hypothetical protein